MSDRLNFRRAEAGDFEVVRGLAGQLAAHIEAPLPPLALERYLAFYVDEGAPMHLLLAQRGHRVLGMIAWVLTHELYSADARVYISDLAVDSSVRGEGIGAALMAEVKAWARTNGAQKLAWDVWYRNFTAKTFYKRLGGLVDDEAIAYLMAIGD